MLKLQYFGHLMRRTDSLEKALMLGNIEGGRRRGWQRREHTDGWHHQLHGHESEQTLGASDGQGGLACCSPWGHKESDTTECLNNNKRKSVWGLSHLEPPKTSPRVLLPYRQRWACACAPPVLRLQSASEPGSEWPGRVSGSLTGEEVSAQESSVSVFGAVSAETEPQITWQGRVLFPSESPPRCRRPCSTCSPTPRSVSPDRHHCSAPCLLRRASHVCVLLSLLFLHKHAALKISPIRFWLVFLSLAQAQVAINCPGEWELSFPSLTTPTGSGTWGLIPRVSISLRGFESWKGRKPDMVLHCHGSRIHGTLPSRTRLLLFSSFSACVSITVCLPSQLPGSSSPGRSAPGPPALLPLLCPILSDQSLLRGSRAWDPSSLSFLDQVLQSLDFKYHLCINWLWNSLSGKVAIPEFWANISNGPNAWTSSKVLGLNVANTTIDALSSPVHTSPFLSSEGQRCACSCSDHKQLLISAYLTFHSVCR